MPARFPVVSPEQLWQGPEFGSKDDDVFDLPSYLVKSLTATVRSLAKAKSSLEHIRKKDFLDGVASEWIDSLLTLLRDGRGFTILRGFPVDGLSLPEIELMYKGLAHHWMMRGVPPSISLSD